METRKLYYEDPHLAEFPATVVSCVPAQGGYLVTLDQTAFYPEGGGQACDIGTLGGVPVTDVQLKDGQLRLLRHPHGLHRRGGADQAVQLHPVAGRCAAGDALWRAGLAACDPDL